MSYLNNLNVMNLLENVYIETTDPESKFTRILSFDVAFSIILHSLLYTFVFYIVKERLPGKTSVDMYKKLFSAW